MRRRNFLRPGSGDTIGGALATCGNPVAAPRALTVLDWNRLCLQAIGAVACDATAAALALATLHTCMYNAWAAYDDDARQTAYGVAVRLPRAERNAASKAGAMSHAAHMSLGALFAPQQHAFDACMVRLGLHPRQSAPPFSPAGIGRTEAASVLDARRNEARLAFALPASACECAPDTGQDSDRDRIPDSGAAAPALFWCRLAHEIGARDGHGDDRDVLMYFVLSNALGDAALARADAGAAAAEVLRSFTGSDRLRAGTPGFSEMAVQDAHARGHAPEASAYGRQVGAQVFEKARRYWQGKL